MMINHDYALVAECIGRVVRDGAVREELAVELAKAFTTGPDANPAFDSSRFIAAVRVASVRVVPQRRRGAGQLPVEKDKESSDGN